MIDSVKWWCLKTSNVKTTVLATNSIAEKHHGVRVYLQVREWKGSAGGFHLAEWRWQECEEVFVTLKFMATARKLAA